jgi:excisionase family DNA binding protein
MHTGALKGQDEASTFLTTEEVLKYLRVKSRTLYRLIRSGDLPAVRVGRQWRIRRRDLDAWLDARRVVHDGQR